MLKFRIDRYIKALPSLCWENIMNALKYVCHHMLLAEGQDPNSLFTSTSLCIPNSCVYFFCLDRKVFIRNFANQRALLGGGGVG